MEEISEEEDISLTRYMDSLERCNKCSACHEYAINGTYSAICPSGEHFIKESYRASGRMELTRLIALQEQKFNNASMETLCEKAGFNPKSFSKRFFTCTECAACDASCYHYSGKHPLEAFKTVRRRLARDGLLPEELKRVGERVLKYSSPFITEKSRAATLGKFFQIPELAKSETPRREKILYFVGCTTSHILPQVASATIKLLQHSNTSFTVLQNEPCCGYPLIHTGQQDLAVQMVENTIRRIEETGVKTVLVSCAGCYQVFSKDYPSLVDHIPFNVVHTVELFSKLIDKNQLKLKPQKLIVTYHDPCNIGRKATPPLYEEPRSILQSIRGVEFVEMERTRDSSFCCGSGGGVVWSYPAMSEGVSQKRVGEAYEVLNGKGEGVLVTACPACEWSLNSAAKNAKSSLLVRDIAEVLSLSI
jgi:Fe-S oxidoreductase